MIDKLNIRPAEGMKVRGPLGNVLEPGKTYLVDNTAYWRRRLAADDVVLVNESEPDPAPAPANSPAPADPVSPAENEPDKQKTTTTRRNTKTAGSEAGS